MTRGMAPVLAALAWASGCRQGPARPPRQTVEAAAGAYARYQRCPPASARRLFATELPPEPGL